MEINKKGSSRVIGATIKKHRDQVINALQLSDVNINDKINDRDLFQTTMAQLADGNNKLIYNLGYVLDKNFDMSSVNLTEDSFSRADGEEHSNYTFTNPGGGLDLQDTSKMSSASNQNSWWSQNSGSVLTAGVGLLGGLFGKKDSPPPVTPPSGGNNNQMMMMMQQQQMQQNQQNAAANARREEEASKRSSNMMIFGIVGAVVVIGGIAAIVMTRR